MNYFPDEVIEHIFGFLGSHKDRNSVSQVCKLWFKIESLSRRNVFIGNCYSISPDRVVERFPYLKAIKIKGKPHFADFNLVPFNWGGYVFPWISAMASNQVDLEELRLKRMVVSDESLELLSASFRNLKTLILVSCEGFTTDGLAAVAANCSVLQELDLQENEIEDGNGHWLSCFPEQTTSLVSLNLACLKGDVNMAVLERLVARSPNLTSLKLNSSVPVETLRKILIQAPQLVDLGVGSYGHDKNHEFLAQFTSTLHKCKAIRSLSGFLGGSRHVLSAFHWICPNITSLNLSYASGIHTAELTKLIRYCLKLQRLWILDCIGDKGLEVVASTCKDLQELRVFPTYPLSQYAVTERGLVAISKGCPRLNSILYFCKQMTNKALITVAKNCPDFIRFRLCTLDPVKPDAITMEPLDEGFGAIVKSCKGLRRFSMSGLLTDKVFHYIGQHGKELEMLSIAFAGESDKGMQSVLRGCKKLRKLEIRDSPFGNEALLSYSGKYETMRSLWMSSCEVTLGGCRALAKTMPNLNVEVIDEKFQLESDDQRVDKMYLYRTVAGRRRDAPLFVQTLG